MYDNKFPSLVASLFSWRCLASSTSSFLHAAMNLRPPSVTVLTHTPACNAVAFQSPVMPNARMSLRGNRSTLYISPSSPHCTLKVSEHDSLWQPPAAHSDERPRPQTFSHAQRYPNALAPGWMPVRERRDNAAHEKTFVGGDAHPNERRAAAKANRVRKP